MEESGRPRLPWKQEFASSNLAYPTFPRSVTANTSDFESDILSSNLNGETVVLAQVVRVQDCESWGMGSIPIDYPLADMMELADILVLETSEATHTGSTPVIGTHP